MARLFSSVSAAQDPTDWVRAASVAGVTAIILFGLLLVIGFAVLFLRRRNAATRGDPQARQQQANILLVRVDDAIKSSEDELGFAIAQFGEERARQFRTAIAAAKQQVAEAFSLQQRLDDTTVDSATQQRDWTARIIQLCESAQASLASYQQRFDALRRQERNAPADLAEVREAIAATGARLVTGERTGAQLKAAYEASAIASVEDNLGAARQELAEASRQADAATARLADDDGTAATDAIGQAEEAVRRAAHLLDAIDAAADTLRTAADAVDKLIESTQANAEEARAIRDAPPDAEASANVGHALTAVDRVLAALAGPSRRTDPVAELEQLREANAALDAAMASARNQQRRLAAARTALAGALVAARSQIATTADFIDTRRGAIGSEARTRLAEARRLLMLAEAEADPVTALDTARRSATYSRDADALARYDVMATRVR